MILPPEYQKARDIYYDKGHEAAWKYWKLLGKTSAIFLGEIPSEEFITGDDLADRVGITEGESQFSNTPWLKFILDFNLMYVPMKPIRHSISWDHIYQAGAVYGTGDSGLYPTGTPTTQDVRVVIDGYTYLVRLLKGANVDQVNITGSSTDYDVDWTHGSEWNKLMYPIHIGSGYQAAAYSITPSESFNQWASYTDDDLLVDYRAGKGSYSWCQEQVATSTGSRVFRGHFGVSNALWYASSYAGSQRGWWPALVLQSASSTCNRRMAIVL